MLYPLAVIICFVLAFLLGSIPCGVLVGKAFFGIDPRSGGSGSIGATNSSRMMGMKGGIAVLVLDMIKGAIAVGVARLLVHYCGYVGWGADALIMGSAFFGVAGHIFSPWLGFKGGKGISTGFGTICTADWRIGIGLIIVFAIGVALTRIVSVGSIAAGISVVFQCMLFHWPSVPFILFGLGVSLLVVWAHRANLKRLAKHEEPKFTGKKTQG